MPYTFSCSPENIRDNVIADYKNGVVSDEYNSDGMYFGNPAQPIVLRDKEDLEKFGLTTPHQVGVDLNTLKPAFKPYTENISEEPIAVVPEPEEKKIMSDNKILEKYKISKETLNKLRDEFNKDFYKVNAPNRVDPIDIVLDNVSMDILIELGYVRERQRTAPLAKLTGPRKLLDDLYSDLGLL